MILASINSFAQNVGIGTSSPNTSAKLDISATNAGVLFPNVTLTGVADATTIATPAKGLVVWNTGSSWGSAAFYYNDGTSGTPSWTKVAAGAVLTSTLTNGKILVGNVSNVATEQTMSGDVTITNAGVTTIGNDKVTTVKILDANVTTTKIANNAVDGTKIQIGSNTNGSLMYYDGTDWVNLAPGTSGQVLRTNGAAAPTWVNGTTAVKAQNGLNIATTTPNATSTDPYVELGGSLVRNTTVAQAANTLTFTTTTTNGFSIDTNTFSVDAANNRVGIGTIAPLGNLHVYSTNSGVVTAANGAMVIDNSVASTFTKGLWLKNAGGGGPGAVGVDIVGETFNGHTGAAPATIRFVDANFATDITFRIKTGQGAINANNTDVEVMRISSLAGNVGIGTTTPGATLNVIHPTSNTTPTKPTGTWAAIIENNQDADDGRHGLSVATRWGASSSKIFEAASYWTGGAQAYTPALTVFGDRTVRVQNLAGTSNRPVYVDANGTLTATASHSGSGYRLFDMFSYNGEEGYVRVNITTAGVLSIVSRNESSGNVTTRYTMNNVASAKVVLLITNDDTGGSGSQISGQRTVTRTNNNSHPTDNNTNDINTDLGKGGSDGHIQTFFIMYNPL